MTLRRLGMGRWFVYALASVLAAATVSLVVSSGAGASNFGTVSGTVTESTGIPTVAQGVCVTLFSDTSSSGFSATTNSLGEYSVSVPYDSYSVAFDPTCNGTVTSSFEIGYYSGGGAADPAIGDSLPVDVDSATAPGIGAVLYAGVSISGTVTNESSVGIANVCVYVYSVSAGTGYAGPVYDKTASNGTYSITNWGGGTTAILFDPTCVDSQTSTYAMQYYNGAPDFGSAANEDLLNGASYSGVDAVLSAGGSISGVISAPGASNLANICVYAFAGTDGYYENLAVTDSSGAYAISNLPADSYKLEIDPTCLGFQSSDFTGNWYDGASGFTTATSQNLSAGGSITGLDDSITSATSPLKINTTSLPEGSAGSAYSASVSASGGDGSYTWSASGLPSGLNINASTGTISGTPGSATTASVTITVQDASVPALSTSAQLSLTIALPPASAPTTTTVPPSPEVVLTTGTVSIPRKGLTTHVGLSCEDATCSGTIQVFARITTTTVKRVKVGKHLVRRVIKRAVTALVAEGSYDLAAGNAQSVSISVTGTGRRDAIALGKQHAPGTGIATVTGGNTSSRKVVVS
jgi:hypothetical protein